MEALEARPEVNDEAAKLYFLLGGINTAHKISETITAKAMTALKQVQEQRLYLSLGHPTFVDFLDNSQYSPMGKNRYYELDKIVNVIGSDEFDLLQSSNVPVSQRRLLTAGDISIEGELVNIADKQYSITDKKAIKKAIARLIEQQNLIETKAAKQEKDLAKQAEQIAELEEARPIVTADVSALTEGITEIAKGFATLRAGIQELNAKQFAAYKKKYARRVDSIIEAYGELLTTFNPSGKGIAELEDDLTDDELAGFLNDED
jgi:hypothetical protein